MLEDKRSLDGIYGTRRYVGSPLELACTYCVQFFRFQSRSQILGQPYQLDTSPKGAERHPRVPFLVYDNVRVNGIKVVTDTITAPVSVHGSSESGFKVLR